MKLPGPTARKRRTFLTNGLLVDRSTLGTVILGPSLHRYARNKTTKSDAVVTKNKKQTKNIKGLWGALHQREVETVVVTKGSTARDGVKHCN